MKTTLKTLLAMFIITSGFVLHAADSKKTISYSPDSLIGIKDKDFARIVIGNVGNTSTDEKSTKEYIVPITPQGQDELLSNLYESNAPDFEINYAKDFLDNIGKIINKQSRIIGENENTKMFMLNDEEAVFKLIKNLESLASIDGMRIEHHKNDNTGKKQQSIGSRAKSVLSYITPRVLPTTLAFAQFLMAINQIKSISYYWAGKN